MAKFIDIVSYGLTAENFAIPVTDATLTTVPTGPTPLTKPYAVFVIDGEFAPGESVISTTWGFSGTNAPQITVGYSTPGITRNLKVVVLYKH
jgi:hypothetical protein